MKNRRVAQGGFLTIKALFSLACFLLFANSAMSGNALPKPIFSLDGEHQFKAVINGAEIEAKSKNAKIVPGHNGHGVYLGADAGLKFPTPKKGLERAGTITFWIKPDFKTQARFQTVLDRDRLPDGGYGAIGCARRFIMNPHPGQQSGIFCDEEGLFGFGAFASIHKRFLQGNWYFVAVTWDAKTKTSRLMIDYSYNDDTNSYRRSYKGEAFSPELIFGSLDGSVKGPSATLDDFNIYDQALSQADLLAIYAKERPIDAELNDYAWFVGQKNQFRVRFKNLSDQEQNENVTITVKDLDGKKISEQTRSVKLAPDAFQTVTCDVTPPKPGLYRVALSTGRLFETVAIPTEKLSDQMPIGDLKLKLVDEIDCSMDYDTSRFRSEGDDKVVHGLNSAYRETANDQRSAFVYHLKKLENPNRYHVLEIEYPDNAKRAFSVTLYSAGNGLIVPGQMNGVGVLTGFQNEISWKNQKKRLLWAPYSDDVTLLCENYKPSASHKGAALAKIKVYETQTDLLPKLPDLPDNRRIGVWDEDPTMLTRWYNMPFLQKDGVDLNFWVEKGERIAEYARHMGYNTWTLQLVAYYGDRNGSHISLKPDMTPGGCGYIYGCNDAMIKVLEREGIPFFGRLGFGWGKDNMATFLLGEAAFSKDIDDYCQRGKKAPELVSKDGKIFRENSKTRLLNPLHPLYLKGMERVLGFYRDKYAPYPNFLGLTLRDTNVVHTLLSLDYGYGDYTVGLFEKETGIHVPCDAKSKKRLQQRYEFLTSPKMKEKWIAWRCAKFAEVSEKLAKIIRKGNDRLRLQSWVACQQSMANSADDSYEPRQALREAGFDMDALAKIEGLDMVPIIRPDYEQINHKPERRESYTMYSQPFAEAFSKAPRKTLNMMLHNNLENYPSIKPKLPELFHPTATWIASKKPFGFSSWANSYPNADASLRPLTNMLANLDPDEICVGWWGNPDSGVTDLYRAFNRAFRSIPKGNYANISGTDVPVTIRVSGDNMYLVNKEIFPVTVTFKQDGNLTDLVTKKNIESKDGQFKLEIPGQALQVYHCSSNIKLADIQEQVKPEALEYLNRALTTLGVEAKRRESESLANIEKELKTFIANGQYTEARRLLYRPEITKILESIGECEIAGTLNLVKREYVVTVRSYAAKPTDISISIIDTEGAFKIKGPDTRIVKNIKPGETRQVTFKLEDSPAIDGFGGTITVMATLKAGGNVKRAFLCGGPYVYHAKKLPQPGADWSFKDYHLTEHEVRRPGKPWYRYRIGYLWNKSGLAVAVEVVDQNYFPPNEKLHPIHADSLQVFFDLNNEAALDSYGFDSGDMEFLLFEMDGKDKLSIQEIPEGACKTDSSIHYAIQHDKSITRYEFLVPSADLPGVAMKPGTAIGASVMINNRLLDGHGKEVLVTSPKIFPYKRPGTWKDLIFVADPAKKKDSDNAILRKANKAYERRIFNLPAAGDYRATVSYSSPEMAMLYVNKKYGNSVRLPEATFNTYDLYLTTTEPAKIDLSLRSLGRFKPNEKAKLLDLKLTPVDPANLTIIDFPKDMEHAPDGAPIVNLTTSDLNVFVRKTTVDGVPCLKMYGVGASPRCATLISTPAPFPPQGKIQIRFRAKTLGSEKLLKVYLRSPRWVDTGTGRECSLTSEWREFQWEVNSSEMFKKGQAKMYTVDFSLGPGIFLFSTLLIQNLPPKGK